MASTELNPFLERLRQALDVSVIIGKYVDLKRNGQEHTGLCPFHPEKTPSFTVNNQKGFYHCFGCGAHGDIITFIMERQGVGFLEAVNHLASVAGLEVPKLKKEAPQKKKTKDILKATADFFTQQLLLPKNHQTLAYLTERGITEPTRQKFELGYAPPDGLLSYLKDELFSEIDIKESGLINAYGHPRFQGRVMFPIHDKQKNIIGFGGRILENQSGQAKYINSAETEQFHKGHVLYGLPFIFGKEFSKKDPLVLVEGYMDVITLQQAGVKAVAAMGTSLTEQHLQEIWKYDPLPIICFDGDQAGEKAAGRAVYKALPYLGPSHSLKFCFMPKGLDPDQCVQEMGGGFFKELIQDSLPFVDAMWKLVVGPLPYGTPEEKAAIKKIIYQVTSTIKDKETSAFYQQDLLNRLDTQLKISFGKSQKQTYKRPSQVKVQSTKFHPLLTEKALLLALIHYPSLISTLAEEIASIRFHSKTFDLFTQFLLGIGPEINSQAELYHLVEKNNFLPLLNQLSNSYVIGYAPFCRENQSIDKVHSGWLDLWKEKMKLQEKNALKNNNTVSTYDEKLWNLLKKNKKDLIR